jgi:hydroxymethylbilane synthase
LRDTAKGPLQVELEIIKTQGDKILDVPLAKVGGKGLFVKEIEEALLCRDVDLAVHSMKDVPTEVVEGTLIAAIPERADPRDALVSNVRSIEELPREAVVGTSSLRRRCQLGCLRPDLKIRDLRGNVNTRLLKLDRGEFDGIILAAAGLQRLGLAERMSCALSTEQLLPAVGQGALGIQSRADDDELNPLLKMLHHRETGICVQAERAMLEELGGGCQVPIGAHAVLKAGTLVLRGLVGHPRGTPILTLREEGPETEARAIGKCLAQRLLQAGAGSILQEVYSQPNAAGR